MTERALRAVDISSSGVRWVEVSTGPQGTELHRWGVLAGGKPEPGLSFGLPALPDAHALAGLFRQVSSRPWKGRPAVLLCLPSSICTARFLRLPATGEAQMRSAVEFEVREALEIEGPGLYWDFLSVSADGTAGGTRVLAVATLAERVRPYLDRLKEAGLEVERLVPQGLASFWALQASLDRDSDECALLLEVGPMESVLTLGNPREVFGFRSVPAGSRYSQDTFWREVGRTIEFFRQRFGDVEPRLLYVAGESEPGDAGECPEMTGMEVRRFHPGSSLRSLGVSGDLHHEDLNRFGGPLGLVAAELAGTTQINLLPSRDRKGFIRWREATQHLRALRRSWPAATLAGLIVLTLLGGPMLIGSARRSRLDQAGVVAARIRELGQEKAWLGRMAKERINWSELFLGLSDVVPGDVNITEISFNEDAEIRIVGNMGGNLAKLAEFIGSLEEKQVLADTRIEKSESEERKLNFVIRAKKGAGKLPTTEEKKGAKEEPAPPEPEPKTVPEQEMGPGEKPPKKPETPSQVTAEPKPAPPAGEEVKAEDGEQSEIRKKEEASARVRRSRGRERSSRGSRSMRVIVNGEEVTLSPDEVRERIDSGDRP